MLKLGGFMTLDNIKEEIEKAKTIVILTHESPDGDAVRKFACNVSCYASAWQRSRYNNT